MIKNIFKALFSQYVALFYTYAPDYIQLSILKLIIIAT
jgi:hypothetical protein